MWLIIQVNDFISRHVVGCSKLATNYRVQFQIIFLHKIVRTYISEGDPTTMCVNLSLNDIYRDPPPLRTILTSLRISEASKPTSNILHSDKNRSPSSDWESFATKPSRLVSFLGCMVGFSKSPSLTKKGGSKIEEDTFCDRVASRSESTNPVQGAAWKFKSADEDGTDCEFPIPLSRLCCSVGQFLTFLLEDTEPPWTG